MIWRVVTRQIATLSEINKNWDINDLYDGNEALDIMDEAERRAAEKAGTT